MDYSQIAKLFGLPIAFVVLVAAGIGYLIWYFESRLKLKDETIMSKDATIDSLERKIKECENLTSDVLIKKYTEIRENLKNQIADANSQKEQDTQKNRELQEKLDEVNSQLESQREIISRAQQFLEDTELPREGKFRGDISSDIDNTVRQQKCIYIPVEIENVSDEIIDNIKKNCPYKLEVVFPGMFKMYLIFHDSKDSVIGFVRNPYTGIYDKDYYVTLLDYLKDVPTEHVYDPRSQDGYPTYEGALDILIQSTFHDISPIDPSIIYIKIPFDEKMLPRG